MIAFLFTNFALGNPNCIHVLPAAKKSYLNFKLYPQSQAVQMAVSDKMLSENELNLIAITEKKIFNKE